MLFLDGISKGDSLIINERGSMSGSGGFNPYWVRSESYTHVGFFTTVKLD